ncbi:MAG: ABC transporter permease subunit [Chloroflexota bacterium]
MTDGSTTAAAPVGPGRHGLARHGPGQLARRWAPAAALVAAAGLLVVAPLLALLGTALEEGVEPLLEAVRSASPSVWASIWTSLFATLLALAVGATIAVLTERTDVPGRRGLRLAMLLALIVPGYVAALGWLNAYGPGGLLDDLFDIAAPALLGPIGVVVVMGVEAAPIAYLIVVAGLRSRAEPDLERAARASGAGPIEAFRSVTLPLLRPVLAGAAAIAFVLSVTAFGVPAVLGIPAGFTTMTTRIYRDLAFSAEPESFVRAVGLAVVLAAGAALIIAVGDWLLDRRRADRAGAFGGPLGSAGRAAPGPVEEGRGRRRVQPRALIGGLVAWAVVVLVVIVPLLGLLATALTRAPGLAPVPANWTLDNFREVLEPRTFGALGNSLILAGAAAMGVIVLAALAVMARRGRGAGLTGGLLGLTFALPGSTLAVAVLLAYGASLRDTLLIILIAYLAKFWALGYRPVAAGLDAIPADAYHAARVSGAGAWTTTRTVVLPLLRPMIIAGGLIVFMFGLHEVTMSSLLYGPGSATLAVVVLNLQQLGDNGLTAALALALALMVGLAALPLLGRTDALARVGWRR